MIFGIIFLTAVVVHIILHWVVLRTFEKRAIASSRLWLQIITQNKLFHRLAFTLQGIIVNIQAVFWLQKGTEAADILTTCAQLWIMMYALLSVFSLLDVILNLAQNALKAMPSGGKLSIRTSKNQNYVMIEISDTGIGISPEKLCHIFLCFCVYTEEGGKVI